MDLWVFRSDYHHCSTGNEITPEEVRGMTDEQKQAAMKFVDAYTELRTAFDTDDYEHEIDNIRQLHESTLSQIQIYIAELEAKNGSLQTELRYLKARLLQQKNSDLDRKLKSIIFKCHPDKWEDHPLATEVVKD